MTSSRPTTSPSSSACYICAGLTAPSCLLRTKCRESIIPQPLNDSGTAPRAFWLLWAAAPSSGDNKRALCNPAGVERLRNVPQGTRACLLSLPDDREDVGRVSSASAFTASTAFLAGATWSLGLSRATPRDHARSWDRRYAPADLARTTAQPLAGKAPVRPSGDSGVAFGSSRRDPGSGQPKRPPVDSAESSEGTATVFRGEPCGPDVQQPIARKGGGWPTRGLRSV